MFARKMKFFLRERGHFIKMLVSLLKDGLNVLMRDIHLGIVKMDEKCRYAGVFS